VSNILADSAPASAYNAAASLVAMNLLTLGNVGGSQAHLNMQPFLVLTFCIALQGIFPSQN
jgi:microcystin-dependent protein